MNKQRNIIIGSREAGLWLAAAVLAAVPAALAHAGFNHVMGTVARVSGNILTIKTAKGHVDVKLADRTELIMNDRKAQFADLKPGVRVVAEVPEESKDNGAQSVKIGAAQKPPAVHGHHDSHKPSTH
jgi:hypothetical protein